MQRFKLANELIQEHPACYDKGKNYFDKQLAIAVCKGKLARIIQTHNHLVYLLKSLRECANFVGVTQKLQDHVTSRDLV